MLLAIKGLLGGKAEVAVDRVDVRTRQDTTRNATTEPSCITLDSINQRETLKARDQHSPNDSEHLTATSPAETLHGLLDNQNQYQQELDAFDEEHGGAYGYGGKLNAIRAAEFRRLAGTAYLDYAGAALYSEQQIQDCADDLKAHLMCNPHRWARAEGDRREAVGRSTWLLPRSGPGTSPEAFSCQPSRSTIVYVF